MSYNIVQHTSDGESKLQLAPTQVYNGKQYMCWTESGNIKVGICNVDGSGFTSFFITTGSQGYYQSYIAVGENKIIVAYTDGSSWGNGHLHAVSMDLDGSNQIHAVLDSTYAMFPSMQFYGGVVYIAYDSWTSGTNTKWLRIGVMNPDLSGFSTELYRVDGLDWLEARFEMVVNDLGVFMTCSGVDNDDWYYHIYYIYLPLNLQSISSYKMDTWDGGSYNDHAPTIAVVDGQIYGAFVRYRYGGNPYEFFLTRLNTDLTGFEEVKYIFATSNNHTHTRMTHHGNRLHVICSLNGALQLLDFPLTLDSYNQRTIRSDGGHTCSLALGEGNTLRLNFFATPAPFEVFTASVVANVDIPVEPPWPAYVNPAVVIQPTIAKSAHPRIVVQTEPPTGDFSDNLHYKILVYSDQEMTNLIHEVDTLANPEKFQYSTNQGNTWSNFPSNGLGPGNYGALLRVNINTGPLMRVWVKAYVGFV